MSTIIPNISKPYLLDEFLASFDFTVCLFTNNIVGNENPINFDQPVFHGYVDKKLSPEKWSVSELNENYATCTYIEPIMFFNNGNENSEQIYGYYVKNNLEDILWYDKFENSKVIDSKKAIIVKLAVNLNKPLGGLSLVSLVLKSSDSSIPITLSSVSIGTETWGDVSSGGYLVDVTGRSFNSANSMFNLLLRSDIVPSSDNPYNFTYEIQSYGFNNLSTSSSIVNSGVTVIEKTLYPTNPPTTTPPATLPPNGQTITLHGPSETKVGLTLNTAIEDSNFVFTYLENSLVSFPDVMLIYINNVLVAQVDCFTLYMGQNFTLNYQGYTLSGVFHSDVHFQVAPPGPNFPVPG
jgi:hypothetical protein